MLTDLTNVDDLSVHVTIMIKFSRRSSDQEPAKEAACTDKDTRQAFSAAKSRHETFQVGRHETSFAGREIIQG